MDRCNCKSFRGEQDGHLDSCSIYLTEEEQEVRQQMLSEIRENGITGDFLDSNFVMMVILGRNYPETMQDIYSLMRSELKKELTEYEKENPNVTKLDKR